MRDYFLSQGDGVFSWHSLSVDETLKMLNSSTLGLTFKEAKRRRQISGANELKEHKKRSLLEKIFTQCNNILIYVLLFASVITALLSHWIDAGVIFIVIVLNIIIGYVQEEKAEQALKSIQKLLSHKATVIRDGRRFSIDAKYLVPGDIIMLYAGDKVPADLRLFNIKSLQIQEGVLTGESMAVNKSSIAVLEHAALGDRVSMAYSGTLVTYGMGEGVVVATGQKTEIGKINELTSSVAKLKTPLLKQINVFGKWLTAAILSVSAITFFIGHIVWHDTSITLFLAVVGLAVAAIPEGLPAIISITFAIGVTRMARRNVIVRHLPAVETTGSITTICSDKTGTLTYNELAVGRIITAANDYNVTGSGYNDIGAIHLNDTLFPLDEDHDLLQLIRAGILCNDAELIKNNDEWQLLGNPIDGALLALGLKINMDLDLVKKNYPRTDFIPFESKYKMMSSLHHDHKGRSYIFVKGAPERILEKCKYELLRGSYSLIDSNYWESIMQDLASHGYRLLAIAVKNIDHEKNDLFFHDIKSDLIFLGIIGLLDPPRPDAIAAVKKCHLAGIRVKMITGDHSLTARAIAEQLSIRNCQRVITGEEIDSFNDEALGAIVQEVDIYARTSPEHKLRLVKALQNRAEVVAMTGDGVNDVPALKQANIGIAMGKKGSEVSKEVADMVLIDDNFASIVHAIEEGRTIYDNIKKTLLFALPTNGGEALIIVTAILLGNLLPISAVQILWLNMVTAVTFALTIAFEPAEGNVMLRSPRKPNEAIISGWLIWRIFFSLSLMTMAGYAIFIYERSINNDIMAARCAVVNMLAFAEFIYLLNNRKLYSSWKLKNIFSNKLFVISVFVVGILQVMFTYLPSMDHFFGVSPIGADAWIRIFLLGVAMLFAVRLENALLSGRKMRLAEKR